VRLGGKASTVLGAGVSRVVAGAARPSRWRGDEHEGSETTAANTAAIETATRRTLGELRAN
jgi:hypothetical protein